MPLHSFIHVRKKILWSRPGSNRGPSACKADVITTTPQDQLDKNPHNTARASPTGQGDGQAGSQRRKLLWRTLGLKTCRDMCQILGTSQDKGKGYSSQQEGTKLPQDKSKLNIEKEKDTRWGCQAAAHCQIRLIIIRRNQKQSSTIYYFINLHNKT